MTFEIPDFMPALPEIFVLIMACVVLVVDLYIKESSRVVTYFLSQITLAGAAMLTFNLHSSQEVITFNGTFVSDSMGDVLKMFIYLVSAVVLLYSRDYLVTRKLLKGEFFVLVLFAVLGMMIMVSAHSLLTVYLGLELMSLSLYALVALDRESETATEAAMKYFILGAIASGLLLYGMSMIYGATGSLDIGHIGKVISESSGDDIVLLFGLAFIIAGLAFKLGAVPFHMWVPDVYHGAPTAVTLFISTAPKIAAFAMLMRVLIDGMEGLHEHWQDMLVILAALSIAVGNVIAIAQTNIKRMLAYSAISHIGFLLLGVLSGTYAGYSASMFYILVYALMGLGGFGMIILLSRAGFEADNIDDFKGLNERSPWFAFMMLILMFSMAGVPPTVGFYAKLNVLSALVDVGMVWLAVYAVLFAVIGAYYYLRIIKVMYFDKPEDNAPLKCSIDMQVLLSFNSLAILVLGIFPSALLGLCAYVIM